MSTYEMILKSITSKKQRNALTQVFMDSTKGKIDVFLMSKRITKDEYDKLFKEMEG